MKIGVIGVGLWGRNLVRVIPESGRGEIKTLCDKSWRALSDLSGRLPGARVCTDYREVLADPEIDVVYVATPPDTHFEIVGAALQARKHVLVEKPLATALDAASTLVDLAWKVNRVLLVGHTFMYSPPVRRVKDLIDSGALGQVFYIDSQRVNLGQVQDSGVVWDLAPHDLSILQYWLGESPVSVYAAGQSYVSEGQEDVAFITLRYASGIVAQLHLSWLAPTKLRRTTVTGAHRMVVYDDLAGPEAVKIYDQGVSRIRQPQSFGEFQLTYRTGDIVIPRLDNVEPLRIEWDHFADCVETGSRPLSGGPEGAEIVRIIEACRRSLIAGRPQVLDRPDAGSRAAAVE
ncbi:MAG: Gfo/Idh/MocA family oxidoreductase [Candidatus Sericytochromatia bacterium]|nr:Gfo/Idh/MocA family oxidoreductase [Candidatus Tanganyikabacteria bacterium]